MVLVLLLQLPIETLQRIVEYLSPWDALQLRRSSSYLYDVVTHFHSYWYRQFCWYLIRQKKRPAMFLTGCDRTHIKELHCELAGSNSGCTDSSHYIYKLPPNRFAIPLNPSDYHPEEQLYIYRFLIHNYRHQRQRASHYRQDEVARQLKELDQTLTHQRRELQRIADQVQRTRKRRALLKNVQQQINRLETNHVFHGKKSRHYKGVLKE